MSNWFGKKRVDAADLAEMLGEALDRAFERHLPDPQKIAESIAGAIENANFSTAEMMGKTKVAFHESQESLVMQWGAIVKEMQTVQQALSDFPGSLQSVLMAEMHRFQEGFGTMGEKMAAVPEALASTLSNNNSRMEGIFEQMTRQFAEQAESIKQTADRLGAQLEQINTMAQCIDHVLQIQKTVDGTLSQVAASDAIRSMLQSVEGHLAETNRYLQEAAKPRVIRLVETDPTDQEPAQIPAAENASA